MRALAAEAAADTATHFRLSRGCDGVTGQLTDRWSEQLLRTSGYGEAGFAAGFDANRPSPPHVLADILCLEARVDKPQLVVDLGSGTGLSTRVWADRAAEVVGVEPSPEMRERAEAATAAESVRFVQAYAQATGLPDGEADIVTCSQSLHWMEPEPTFAEAARLLRPGGVFAAYDYDLPPTCAWEAEAAWDRYGDRREAARKRFGIQIGADRWKKSGHLDRLRASGRFRFCAELVLQSVEPGSAERLVGLGRSLGLPAAGD